MAIPVSQAVKTALAAPVKQLRSVITWTGADMTPHQITSEDRIISIKKEAEGYYFASALRKVTITTVGTEMDLLDQDVQITIQVKLPSGTWGSIPWGTFAIREAKATENKETVTFTGYAGIYRLQEREYTGGELTFPNTVGGLIQDLATGMGLTINPEIDIDELPNADAPIDEDLWANITGTTYRDILEELAGATGTLAVIGGGDDTLDLNPVPVNTVTDTTDESHLITFKIGQNWGPANAVVLSRQPQGDNIEVVDEKAVAAPTGKNLLNIQTYYDGIQNDKTHATLSLENNAITWINDTNDSYFPAIWNYGGFSQHQNDAIKVEPNTPYVLSFDLSANLGSSRIYIYEGDENYAGINNTHEYAINTNRKPHIFFTTSSTTKYIIVRLARWEDTSTAVTISNMQLAKKTGKNILDPNRLQSSYSRTQGGVTLTKNSDDTFTISGSGTQSGVFGSSWVDYTHAETVALLSGPGTYTLSTTATGAFYPGLGVELRQNSATVGSRWLSGPGGGTIEITQAMIDNPTFNLRFSFYGGSGQTIRPGTFGVQFEKGPATAYEPFVPTYEEFQATGRTDVVVTNNQILDKQRETTATPLLNAVLGWQYREATYKTEGHGYHEIGDRIDVTIDDTTYPTIVTKSVIIVDGGINETLTSTTPEKVAIDYSKAGGITKTIYNTELAVDKQHQEIEAIVSRQDQTDETISENYTRLLQTINNIQATVQVSGGGNLIKNSVGFGKQSDGTLTIWNYGTGADTTTVKSQSSTASLNAGAIAGHEIDLTGATISQNVQLTAGETYNLSFRVQKSAVGTATVTITDGINTTSITAQDQTAYNWNQLSADFTPTAGGVTVTLTTSNCTAAITDLMLAQGGRTGWRQASGEIYNLQVSVDQDGVQVKSATYAGDYTAITPLEFAGYSNAGGTMKKVFTINRDVTEVEKLKANSQIKMPPMEIVPIDNANYKGWAFVKSPD